MQTPEPQEQHRWLLQLVGEWDYESECNMGPDKPLMKSSGKQTTRGLGELWIIGEISGSLPDVTNWTEYNYPVVHERWQVATGPVERRSLLP